MQSLSLSPSCLQPCFTNTQLTSKRRKSRSNRPTSKNGCPTLFKEPGNLDRASHSEGIGKSTKPAWKSSLRKSTKLRNSQKYDAPRIVAKTGRATGATPGSVATKPQKKGRRSVTNRVSSKTNSLLLTPEASVVGRNPKQTSLMESTMVCKEKQSVRVIQAISRGYLCRAHFKRRRLMRKLKDIQDRKKTELLQIEARKKKLMLLFGKCAVSSGTPRNFEGKWKSKSETVTSMLAELRDVRKTNAKLKRELAECKQSNQRLIIQNTRILTTTADREREVNKLKMRALELRTVAYGCLQCLRSVQENEFFCDYYDVRNEIQLMIFLAEKEDALLLSAAPWNSKNS